MRGFPILTVFIQAVFLGAIVPVTATTLQQLSIPQMAEQSTSIVRVKVVNSGAILRGGDVYTVYQMETLETLKAPASPGSRTAIQEVAVPGGVAGGIRQVMAGAPELRVGAEYVLFLWTSRSGLTQIMGLSQGLFAVQPDSSNDHIMVTRASASEHMLDRAGNPVRDQALVMKWTELKAQVDQALHSRSLAANAAVGRR